MKKYIIALVIISAVGLTGCYNSGNQSETTKGTTSSELTVYNTPFESISIDTENQETNEVNDFNNGDITQPIINGSFAIRNIETGKNIRPYNSDKSDENNIILYPHNEWKCLTWQFNHIDGTAYQLQNLYTLKTFEPMSAINSGVALWQQPLNEDSTQWEFIEQQDGIYTIRLKDTELYITISSNKTDTAIILMPFENSNSQQWELIEQYPNV